MNTEPFIFISYQHEDRHIAIALSDALREQGVSTWVDADNLTAGVDWASAIHDSLRAASGLVVIATSNSLQSKWVMQEIRMVKVLEKGIFPVVVGDFDNLPLNLRHLQAAVLPENPTAEDFKKIADHIAHGLQHLLHNVSSQRANFEELSDELLKEARTIVTPPSSAEGFEFDQPDSIFVVHGHDENALKDVKSFVREIGVRPIVLREVEGTDQSLLQRFFRIAGEAKFAVVILSADDIGAGRFQYDVPSVGEKSLQFRARQNVILELGFFYGLLGWDHVFVLLKDPSEVFPNFEMPSDINGAVYDRIDYDGRWKSELQKKLESAGFKLN